MGKFENIAGKRFGYLTVVKRLDPQKGQKPKWLCVCDCGNSHIAYGYNLKKGAVKSCGCMSKEMQRKTMETNYRPIDSNCVCPVCGKEFHVKPSRINKAKIHYCSKECFYLDKSRRTSGQQNHQYGLTREKNASWNGGKNKFGYITLYTPGHPMAGKTGLVSEHRLVAEKYLLTSENSVEIDGVRYLKKEYVVHHINHKRDDNRPENLVVLTRSEHSRLHAKEAALKRDNKTGRFLSQKQER